MEYTMLGNINIQISKICVECTDFEKQESSMTGQ